MDCLSVVVIVIFSVIPESLMFLKTIPKGRLGSKLKQNCKIDTVNAPNIFPVYLWSWLVHVMKILYVFRNTSYL